MNKLSVSSRHGAYPVLVGTNVISGMDQHLESLGVIPGKTKISVITDDTVERLAFANTLTNVLQNAGFDFIVMSIPAGDASKSLDLAATLYPKLLAFGMRRKDFIIALGGGVVGDLAGFVSATYLRGIPFVQVPTTLLSHDSSVGGKVGVNLPQGKNLVGAFYPPKAVLFDVSTLTSLPDRQWRNGMAEVIKHGMIGNRELFERLEREPLLTCPDPVAFEPILTDAIKVKVEVVEADELESGRRQVLNVGHTVGHAIEQRSHYQLGHGESISIGMVIEARLAEARGLLSKGDMARIERVLVAHGLPVRPPADDFASIQAIMDVDKKHKDALWTFALPTGIGDVTIVSDVEPNEVKQIYENMLGEA